MESRSKFTIRTSDRRQFRRCKRKWEFTSSLKSNLKHKGTEQNINFWFGSAIHFALEDYHGYNIFGDPRKSFWAYCEAFPKDELPEGYEHHLELGLEMLTYYLTWYERHNKQFEFETVNFQRDHFRCKEYWDTFVEEDELKMYHPSVEVKFNIPLNVHVVRNKATDAIFSYGTNLEEVSKNFTDEVSKHITENGEFDIVPLYYHGTIDRIVKDCFGRYWLLDYKTAKGADTNKLETDDQITAYLWAASKIFNFPIHGFIYLQLTKDVCKPPKVLKNGDLSCDKRQKTTYALFKNILIERYGSVQEADNKYIDFLNYLASEESEEGDRFIRWDYVTRTTEELVAHEGHIYAEMYDMLNSQIVYPNPTRDCIWDCNFRDACLALDRGEMEEYQILMESYEERPRNEDGNIEPWRENINWQVDYDIDELLSNLAENRLEVVLNNKANEGTEDQGFKTLF